jgi:hypothetical protein
MKYNLFLKCKSCGKESIKKEYDVSDSELDKIIKIGEQTLKFPMYLICPGCHNFLSVKLIKEEVKC